MVVMQSYTSRSTEHRCMSEEWFPDVLFAAEALAIDKS